MSQILIATAAIIAVCAGLSYYYAHRAYDIPTVANMTHATRAPMPNVNN